MFAQEFENVRTVKMFSCSLSSKVQAAIIIDTFSQYFKC